MNKPMNYMSTSLMENRLNSSASYHNNIANTSARVYSNKKQHPDMNHSIDFNHLAEKLKKLQEMTENEPDDGSNHLTNTNPIPSSYSPSKSTIKYRNPTNPLMNTTERERLKPPAKKSLPRSLSNLDKNPNLKHKQSDTPMKRSADRSQSQLHHNKSHDLSNQRNNQTIYDELGEESNDFFKTSKTLQNKDLNRSRNQQQQLQQKLNMVRNSLNLSSMKQAATNNGRRLSESLRSNSSLSSSDTSRSENISFQSESLVSLSCSSRSSSSSPKHRKQKPNETQNKKNIKRGVSSLGVPNSNNKPKIIVIRREKSIACQSSTNDIATASQQQQPQQKQHKSTKIHKNKYVNEEHLIMKQNLLASLSIPLNSNHDANNSGHSQTNQVISNSSTTSGIELSSKNSTNGVNSANGDGSSENITKMDMNHTVKNSGDSDETENRKSSTINELKNRIFIMELELDNQGKKLAQEKELKRKLVTELKTRHETEKHAALKALDAKLNAEKLFELNKLKEQIDVEKRDESDLHQRSFDCELLNLKLKLREKSEKCSKLEKMLKEEQNKNTLLFSKSMEIVKKYNQEMKHFNGMQAKGNVSIQQVQTDIIDIEDDFDKRQNAIKEQLIHIQSILETEPNGKADTNLQTIIKKIETLAKKLKTNNENSTNDIRSMQRQYDKLNDDYKSCKEAKQKLESLYKIKCKSDLNKSAQIKKCQLNYEHELLKFRNEFNCDLVLHLESQLSSKESKIFEQNNQLENVIDLIDNLNTLNLSDECLNRVNIIKDSIKVINSNLKKNMNDVHLLNNASNSVKVTKVFNPSVVFARINDDMSNDGLNNSNLKSLNDKEKNRQLNDQIEHLDRQLTEMKIANKKLINEKQELLNQTGDSQNKSSNLMNVTVIENQCADNNNNNNTSTSLSNRLIQSSTFDRRLNFPKKSSSSVRDNFVKTGSHFASRKSSVSSPVKHGYMRSSQQTDLNLVKEKQNQSAPI